MGRKSRVCAEAYMEYAAQGNPKIDDAMGKRALSGRKLAIVHRKQLPNRGAISYQVFREEVLSVNVR